MELKQGSAAGVFVTTELLIVPYGIETPGSYLVTRPAGLLIVPYGIETLPKN